MCRPVALGRQSLQKLHGRGVADLGEAMHIAAVAPNVGGALHDDGGRAPIVFEMSHGEARVVSSPAFATSWKLQVPWRRQWLAFAGTSCEQRPVQEGQERGGVGRGTADGSETTIAVDGGDRGPAEAHCEARTRARVKKNGRKSVIQDGGDVRIIQQLVDLSAAEINDDKPFADGRRGLPLHPTSVAPRWRVGGGSGAGTLLLRCEASREEQREEGRRHPDSNRGMEVLQTSPLTTWAWRQRLSAL